MTRLMKAALAVCLAISLAGRANAAAVSFTGSTTVANSLFAAATPVTLLLNYTPAVGLVAAVTSATFTIDGQTWSTLVGAANQIAIVPNGALNDDLVIDLDFAPSVPGGFGSVLAHMNLTITGDSDLGPAPDASEANVNAIIDGNPGSGSLFLLGPEVGGLVVTSFSGTAAAVPEPGSIALLSCLGMVVGRRAWKRRQTRQTNSVS
jgi:hypothetical protein